MKTVIITGANGNLGAAVTSKFLETGYKVIAIVATEVMLSEMAPHDHLYVQAVNLMNEEETAFFVKAVMFLDE